MSPRCLVASSPCLTCCASSHLISVSVLARSAPTLLLPMTPGRTALTPSPPVSIL
ncbi:hypothetical protein M440DRAFT_1404448 [Trichoderma longibrachiatum ATCC 18648]|uniref:Uncharacterized protein n=1 Tax=Trichoderma longibrachiatum ATCC 18648 TaxID=983965 RepID=A0A2T4BVV5_TRILO|nr:hypothetical protein M440DRAFT_1404448 [Trichoderma longibrachiatum ATCC 18648]